MKLRLFSHYGENLHTSGAKNCTSHPLKTFKCWWRSAKPMSGWWRWAWASRLMQCNAKVLLFNSPFCPFLKSHTTAQQMIITDIRKCITRAAILELIIIVCRFYEFVQCHTLPLPWSNNNNNKDQNRRLLVRRAAYCYYQVEKIMCT